MDFLWPNSGELINMKIDYKNIELFIFDFGGVLYEINQQRTLNLIKKLSEEPSLKNVNNNLETILSISEFHQFETGKIDESEFRTFLKNRFLLNSSDIIIDDIWNSTLTGIFSQSYDIIKIFKELGKIALLSNTNIIHYNKFEPECRDLFSIFDYLFYSFKIGLRKPEKEIYEYVLRTSDIKPENALFFDDSPINLISAADIGIKTFQITNPTQFIEFLRDC